MPLARFGTAASMEGRRKCHLMKGEPELQMSAACSATTKSLFLSSSASVE